MVLSFRLALSVFFNISRRRWSSPFPAVGCFLVLAGPSARVPILSPPNGSTTSWKRQAVRMTSSCHRVFYVSLRVLTLSILLPAHWLFCGIMLKPKKCRDNIKEPQDLIFDGLQIAKQGLHNGTPQWQSAKTILL